LANHLGGVSVAGGKIKTTGLEFWDVPNTSATNESRFNAKAGGRRGVFGDFGEERSSAYWWSTTEFESNPIQLAYGTGVDYLSEELIVTFYGKEDGHSIRCIKD
jgi:uncharacterized protein (TIGR02145 family)